VEPLTQQHAFPADAPPEDALRRAEAALRVLGGATEMDGDCISGRVEFGVRAVALRVTVAGPRVVVEAVPDGEDDALLRPAAERFEAAYRFLSGAAPKSWLARLLGRA
jgi:hypothetical protein